MFISAFDLATMTGCCAGEMGGKPRCWSWDLHEAGEGRPRRLGLLMRNLRSFFDATPCDRAVYEAPQTLPVMARLGASDDVIAFLRGSVGVLEATCAERDIPVEALSVQDARGAVLGWRTNKGVGKPRAKSRQTKDRVLREVRLFHKICAENDNEADAAVTWLYACSRLNPRLAVSLTPLFRGL